MPTILSAEYPLHVETSGDDRRPALVLLNPLGTTLEVWEPLIEPLAARNWVIRFDTRGHGRSAGDIGDLTLDVLAADALAVLDALEVPRSHLVGDGLGAMVGATLAVNRPGRVDRLVLASCGVHLGDHSWWEDIARRVEDRAMIDVVSDIQQAWFSESFIDADPASLASTQAMLLAMDPEVFVSGARLVQTASLEEIENRLQASTLLIGGEEDPFFKHYPITDLLSMIPSCEAVHVSGARHRVLLEQPEVLASLINEFLSDPDAR